MRRDFSLPEEDMEWLESLGRPYELVREGAVQRVVLHEYPVPDGYTVARVSINVRIEPGYPDAQIDMAYFHPPLARRDGATIGSLANDPFDGRNWQRWSRHRTPANPWRPGVDNLSTHFALVDEWLVREFRKC
jgi:hypothetical protein